MGSISGMVVDSLTGAPMAKCAFRVQRFRTTTDAQGRYSIKELAPGRFPVYVSENDFQHQTVKTVTLLAGQDLTVDFRITPVAHISGRVLDENKEPVPGVQVWTEWTEYFHGALRQVVGDDGESDDQGSYTIDAVESGHPLVLQAQKLPATINAIAEAPVEPKLRKLTAIPTYYLDAVNLAAAERLILRAGERREAVDIHLRKAPAFCADGVIEGAHPLNFFVSSACTSTQHGKTGPDGKFRICNLHPGDCQLRTNQAVGQSVLAYGLAAFTVRDADIHDLKVPAQAPISLGGEVLWAGDPPDPPPANKVMITLRPIGRPFWYSDFAALTTQSPLPGPFAFSSVLISDYYVLVTGLTGNQYVKDITYSGISVLHGSFRAGTAAGNRGLQVTLASDGAFLNASVADKDGKPVDAYVLAMPANAGSDPILADSMVSGQTDQNGAWRSSALPPGRYYVLVESGQPKPTPETITRLRRSQNRAQEIDLRPNGAASAKLPAPIE